MNDFEFENLAWHNKIRAIIKKEFGDDYEYEIENGMVRVVDDEGNLVGILF